MQFDQNEVYEPAKLTKWAKFCSMLPAGGDAFRYVLVAAVLISPPVYLAMKPEHFTPLVDTLFSVFMFLLAYWIGAQREVADAMRRANEKWLPQAESVTYRLLTLFANVKDFAQRTKGSCDQSSCELPELKEDGMKAVRIKFKTECEANSRRLEDIANQLEDAIGDWQRFIAANCYGEECQRIFEALKQREDRLLRSNEPPHKTLIESSTMGEKNTAGND